MDKALSQCYAISFAFNIDEESGFEDEIINK